MEKKTLIAFAKRLDKEGYYEDAYVERVAKAFAESNSLPSVSQPITLEDVLSHGVKTEATFQVRYQEGFWSLSSQLTPEACEAIMSSGHINRIKIEFEV